MKQVSMKLNLKHLISVEDGLALTEYLILLGVIAGGLIATVGLFGTELSNAWSDLHNSIFGSDGINTIPSVNDHD